MKTCLNLIRAWLATAGLAIILVATTDIARSDDPDYGGELPRISPREPHEALASFRLSSEEFAIEQVAAEPLLASPVALDFDADGRMFVAEMRDYSEQSQKKGQVRKRVRTSELFNWRAREFGSARLNQH